jgi:hypothetical protein
MSEPMSSVEIEDVLSSIRRLVSEDLRPATPRTPAPAENHAPAPAAEQVASKLILTPALRVVPPETKAEAAPATAVEDWDEAEQAAFVAVDDDTLADPADESGAGAEILTLSLPGEAAAAPDATWVEVETPEATGWTDPPVAAAEAEPVDSAAPDPAWADAAEAEVRRQLAGDLNDADEMPGAAMTMEEEILRELVRDIIREELQGALGERITRNVRKLVRAEIARAAALRDFE